VPALQSTRTDLVSGLKATDVDVPGRKRLWGRNVLVVAQVSASLMLLTASFLMVRGFHQSLLEGTGFAKDHLLTATFDPRLVQYNTAKTRHSDVLRLVMGKGLVLVGIGAVIGLAMGFAVEQLMNSMLFDAGGVDVLAYIIVVPSMFLVTMLASYLPARRASRIAPTQALRYE
jgi:hypothetical protein